MTDIVILSRRSYYRKIYMLCNNSCIYDKKIIHLPKHMRDLDNLFAALTKSSFRTKFHLQKKDLDYLHQKGFNTILEHTEDFVGKRLAPAYPDKDGKQTPYKGHPVFIAQHATACCCRSCLEKWHQITKGRALTENEIAYICAVIEHWLRQQSEVAKNRKT